MARARIDVVERADALVGSPVLMLLRYRFASGLSEARLDVRIPEQSGRGRILNVDIGFADPYTADLAELRRRARKPGRAAAAYVYLMPAWPSSSSSSLSI